jgi:hypothetical protein
MANRMSCRAMVSPDNMLFRLSNIGTICLVGGMVTFPAAHSPMSALRV